MQVESAEPVDAATTELEQFDSWVQPYLVVLRALAIRELGRNDADDLVQDTLVRAWRKRHTYKSERGSAKVWLVAILLDQARRKRSRTRLELLDEPQGPATDEDVSVRVDVDRAVRTLPRRQREVITLFYLADLSVADVATALGISAGSVKTHLAAARAALRDRLEPS